jgi:preprotein translocase subunit SecY
MTKPYSSSPFINIFRIPDLRKKVLITFFILFIYRLGSYIPVPGIDINVLKTTFATAAGSGLLDYIDLFTGGGLRNFTIFALSIMPYITAEIILQLLIAIIPALEKMVKEGGEAGRKKIQLYARIGTIFICAIQAFTLTKFIISQTARVEDLILVRTGFFYIISIVTITTGTMFLIWLGDKINDYGIGNGISLIIFAGIVARFPAAIYELYKKVRYEGSNMVMLLIVVLMFILVIVLVIYEQQGQRRIPLQQAKRIVGRKVYQGQSTYIPLKLNPSGVIPIIFASTFLIFPSQLMQMLGTRSKFLTKLVYYISPGTVSYLVIYSLLVIFFAYFYTQVILNPVEIAENLKKSGGYIPGIRPGKNTEDYLNNVITRIILPGSIFLAFIAILPNIANEFFNLPTTFAYLMGGTSLLIVVGVALDTINQIESQLIMHHYDGFLSKGRIRGRR